MKKALKFSTAAILIVIVFLICSCAVISEKLPTGTQGPEAEALTDRMFDSINKVAWDSTRIVQWSFPGDRNYIWNKEKELLKVAWKKNEVIMNLPAYDGITKVDGKIIEGRKKKKMIDKAYKMFCNDSFWLCAPNKARDEGTTRSVIDLEGGEKGLLVQYSSGGVTPGDSYLWLFDENGRPKAWKIWVKILPIKGIELSWTDWTELESGAQISTKHEHKWTSFNLIDVNSGNDYLSLGIDDPFLELK